MTDMKQVGLDEGLETRHLSNFSALGFSILHAVTVKGLQSALNDLNADEILLIVRTRDELEQIRGGAIHRVREKNNDQRPIIMLGLHGRIPRRPVEQGLDGVLHEPAE